MTLAIWNCFLTPFFVAFHPYFESSAQVVVIDIIIDLFFFIDVLLNFRTTFYISATGDEIFDIRLIARNYIMGKFWIDVLSCLPSDLFLYAYYGDSRTSNTLDGGSVIMMLGIIKIYRISRLNRIILFMRAKSSVKMAIRIL